MSEASVISRTTSVKLQLAALFGLGSFLVLATWGVATYSTGITSGLAKLNEGQSQLRDAQDKQATAFKELSERFELLRTTDDTRNWKVWDQATWTKTFQLLNPSLKLPEVQPR